MRIFDMDGPLYRIGNEIADVLIIGILWLFCSLPVITLGTSTSAVFYVYGKKARGEDTYIFRDFFKSFRMNFKQSIPITIILLIMWASMYAYGILMQSMTEGNAVITGLALFFSIEVIILTLYVLAILSRFHMKVFNIFLTAFVLAHRHMGTTLIILGIIIGLQLASFPLPIIFFFMPILVIALSSIFIQKVFKKHIDATAAQQEAAAQQVAEDGETDEYEEDEEAYDEDVNDVCEEVVENDEAAEEACASEDALSEEDEEDQDKSFIKYL